jgi:lysylphosphatidylglycerol synthetase-like protein (DUF2156 family)
VDFLGLPSALAEGFSVRLFVVNLALTILFSSALAFLFQRFSLSFSDRSRLASTFVLLGVATMCVISVVKVSLALSLGLVGALSIVRFRTAIKDPEELIFLFLIIVIGIAHGANQSVIGAAAFVVSAVLILARYVTFTRINIGARYSHMVLTGSTTAEAMVAEINRVVATYKLKSELCRVDSTRGNTECVLNVLFADPETLTKTIAAFAANDLSITYISDGKD